MIKQRVSIGGCDTLQYRSALKKTVCQTIGAIPHNMEDQQIGLQTQDTIHMEVHSPCCQWIVPYVLCDTCIQTIVTEIQ